MLQEEEDFPWQSRGGSGQRWLCEKKHQGTQATVQGRRG